MKREPSTAARSLRAVSLAITLIAIVTVSTVGYSAYQEFSALGPALGQGAGLTGTPVNSTLVITMNATIPNRGLYPIVIKPSYTATAYGAKLSSASFPTVTLPPGSDQKVSTSGSIDFLSVNDTTLLSRMLLNGTQVTLTGNFSLSVQPFAGIWLAGNSSVQFAPPLGSLHVARQGTPVVVLGVTNYVFPASFEDRGQFGFPFRFYYQVYSGNTLETNSTETVLQALPGQITNFQLAINANRLTGTTQHSVVLHMLLAGRDIVLATVPIQGAP